MAGSCSDILLSDVSDAGNAGIRQRDSRNLSLYLSIPVPPLASRQSKTGKGFYRFQEEESKVR